MSLKLYMDHNVHAGITQGLRERSVDCLTAYEDGMAAADDAAVLQRATDLQRIVFTQDLDFVELAVRWSNAHRTFSGVVYARQMGITIGQAIMDLELVTKVVSAEEMANQVEWIPLS